MKNSFGKKLYSVRESYWILYKGFMTMKYMARAKKNNELSPEFIKRIMLAVTEVNGCAICSYFHSKMAIEMGMDIEEIQGMLAGIFDNIPEDEAMGVLFAQHYADSRGNPSKEAWERILKTYGISKSGGILASIRIIMIGNVYGIAWSSFFNRFRGKPDKRSNFFYELSMAITFAVFMPVALGQALVSVLSGKPIISF